MIIQKIFQRFKRKEKIIIIKEITYIRFYVLLLILFLIDTISSYFATQHPKILEANSISAYFFSFGIIGLYLWCSIVAILLFFLIILMFSIETTFFKDHKDYFRLKILYLIFGMYAFVFTINLKTLISIYLQ